ncbi:MAG: 50S ribosomal protein L13 [Candidatus Fraserbacteria bacterium RBG_16_55_9]|uniref:Large ribosomal subunit protein uL13 n=1 Tax=Fraserbacteria sp. (strain RBG_16_55_9) TaxID=1817864 RepID=A0A1F5UY62_FRAXR|nr:MAG: 50S ribosomal protein L13 [Candidatus Fraserbacteria bacterium RBG_16_55_9]
MQKTILAKKEEMGKTWNRNWYVIDAQGKTLGRLAARIAHVLMGKHKPLYTKHVDVGDYLVVINAEKIGVTGKKRAEKMYYNYSGYPGGMRERTFENLLQKHPTQPLYQAVQRMIPRTTMGRRMLKKLKVYAGPEHPHDTQNPQKLEL